VAHRPPLVEGAGRGKTLLLDAFSGIAGDMTIAALVDLGVPFEVVRDAILELPLSGVTLTLDAVRSSSIGASHFDVLVEGAHPERSHAEIDRMIAAARLAEPVRTLARAIFRKLAEAEAEVHRIPVDEVHFHEVGAVDAIVDVVGAATCFTYIGADVVCSPLPLGRGSVECRHGVLPLPAPAAVACLKGVPTYDAGIEAELVTPTGAAIASTVARRFVSWPSFSPERIGWGAGTLRFPDRPNVLRAVLGSAEPAGGEAEDGGSHAVLEANVDDMTGELAAHAIAAFLAEGALDAWAVPATMKKGRPGLVLSVLCRRGDAPRLSESMLRETSSIGVRYRFVSRVERPRVERHVGTRFGEIPVKVSGGPYGAPVLKPEFDACARAAARAGVPVRVVIAEALAAAERGEDG
jgi:uncharacterized protein (TIGR00299 family) protein